MWRYAVKKTQALGITLLLGAAAAAGALALVRTTAVAQPAGQAAVPDSVIAQLNRELDRSEAKLERALARRAPKLPPATVRASASRPEQIVYVRPKPVVVHSARAGEHEQDRGESDGAGFDD
jgi:hypothetical protein